MESRYVLGYWDGRGMANPIRYLLEYTKANYVEELYSMQKRDAWLSKKTLDPEVTQMPFPNLPYLYEKRSDGSIFRITQSQAIMRYLARNFGLAGNSSEEQAYLEMIEGQIHDIRDFMRRYNCEEELFLTRIPDFRTESVKMFQQFANLLGDKKFLAKSDCITYVDFYLYEILQVQKLLNDTVFDQCPNLAEFCRRIENLPQISRYLKSDRFKPGPFFGPWAKRFGYP